MYKSTLASVMVEDEDDGFTEDSVESDVAVPETFVADGVTYKTFPCAECSCAQCTTPMVVEYNGEQAEGYYNCACGSETITCMCLGCRQERGKSETKDAYGNVLTSSVTDGNSTMMDIYQYTYNAVGTLTQVSQLVSGLTNGTTMTANYTYSDDRITSISHLGTTYNFEYDDYGNQTCVKVGEQPLVSYSYNTKKIDINKITYGNGFIINYVLDTDGNIIKIKYDGATATPNALTDKNLYLYCDNNPINRVDNSGEFWNVVIGAAIGGLIGGISSIVGQSVGGQKINLAEVGISAASGVLTGVIVTVCPGMGAVATGIVHGVVGAGTHAAIEVVNGRTPTVKGTLVAGVTSGSFAVGTKAVANLVNKGFKIQKIGRLEASNHANDPQLGIKYKINKPNGRSTTRSFEFHYNHYHKGHKPHWQRNSWNIFNNSVSSLKHWTWRGKRI